MGNMRPSRVSPILVNLGLAGQERVSNRTIAFRGFKLKNVSSVDSKFKVVKARNGDLDKRQE